MASWNRFFGSIEVSAFIEHLLCGWSCVNGEQSGSVWKTCAVYFSAQAWSIGELVTYHSTPAWGKLKLSLMEKLGGILEVRKLGFFGHSFGMHTSK